METILSIGVLFAFPLAMLVLLKTNAGIMFLAACAGLVLLQNIDGVVITTAGAVVPSEGEAYVRLAVVMLSVVFAGLIFRETVRGGLLGVHSLLILILGAMLWLLLPAVTGVSWLVQSSQELPFWQTADNFKALIITAGIILSLLLILVARSKNKKKH